MLDYNRDTLAKKSALMAQAMALPDQGFDSFKAAIVALLDQLEIPKRLETLGVSETQIPEIANKAHTDVARTTNPVPSTVPDIEKILIQSMTAAR